MPFRPILAQLTRVFATDSLGLGDRTLEFA